MMVLELEPEHVGKLVALEGDAETIDTQLRLLPPSQKILIVPALPDIFSLSSNKGTFNARTFIRNVHTAFTERSETARAFLRSSTSKQPRLCILSGGSVSARATCISKIASNLNGDIEEAETIFNEIVKDGVASLMKLDDVDQDHITTAIEDVKDVKVPETVEHPTVRAMKAADSLDRETESLRPDSARSISPGLEHSIDSNAIDPSYTAGQDSTNGMLKKAAYPNPKGNDIVRTVLTVPSRSRSFTVEGKRSTFGPQYSISTLATASTLGTIQASEDIEEDNKDIGFVSPRAESLLSLPATPAVYAEAFLVDVQSGTPTKAVRKTQSVDMLYPSNSRLLVPTLAASPLRHTASDYHLRGSKFPKRHGDSYQTLPRTTFVKASQTTIKKSPTCSSVRSNSSSVQGAPPCVYVDRGEDAFSPIVNEPEQPFVPVFPVAEDLVIHLVDDNANVLLESVINSYKEERYPIMPTPAFSSQLSKEEHSPITVSNEQHQKVLRRESYHTAETDDMGYERRHDYDPYDDSYSPGIKRQWPPMPRTMRLDSLGSSVGPPTPTLTPPPVPQSNSVAKKFINFTPIDPNNAINVQNSLRQLLSLHFPAGENGYSQHYYPVAPEADRLWKPVFRNDQSTIIGNDDRNVDQVIALGCEDGVKKDFFFQISGQVEKLGSKRDGLNRSGKLDIRYLVSDVMQRFSAFSTKSSFNPLSSPHILAALLVPQIEAYLAINANTRLLILQYPASHLSTVFALRKLLGSDILKIGGILDSLASDPPSMSRPRTPSPLSNEAVTNRAQSQARLNSLQKVCAESKRKESISTLDRPISSAGSVNSSLGNKSSASFAKADYLLPSTATDAEITTFLSSIRKCLMEKSAFYTPELEPKPIIVERPPMPPPLTSTSSSRDIRRDRMDRERDRHRDRENTRHTGKDSGYPSSYRHGIAGSQSKISRLTGGAATGPSSPRSIYSPSVISTHHRDRDQNTDYDFSTTSIRHKYAGSIASTKTTNSEKQRRRDKEWENFYVGDEDSEDDAFDRMIMGRAGQRIVPEPGIKVRTQKRDKRKALKWLGLA